MQHTQAVKMISGPHREDSGKQVWADLGCGTGTFTLALASLLRPNSRITAVDKDGSSLDKVPDQFNQVSIEKMVADFVDVNFSTGTLDGVLMANSLHFCSKSETLY